MELQKLICRAFEPKAAKLCIEYATFVCPALVAIDSHTVSTFSGETTYQYVFASANGLWTTEDFTATLSTLLGQPEYEGGVGMAFTMSSLRHLLIALIRRHCQSSAQTDALKFVEEIQRLQVGHDRDASTGYAVTTDSCRNMSIQHLIAMQELSVIHHGIISPSTAKPHPVVGPHAPGALSAHNPQPPSEIATLHLEQHMAQQFSTLAANLKVEMIRSVAEGVGLALTTHHPPEVRSSSADCDGPMPVVLDDHTVHPARYQELRVLYGPSAKFQSREQAVATQICTDRQSDLLLVLPTGLGKSVIFMMVGLN